MLPQTSIVFHDKEIIPYKNPDGLGKALYMLIISKLDAHFQ
jgi:hypothetical protein